MKSAPNAIVSISRGAREPVPPEIDYGVECGDFGLAFNLHTGRSDARIGGQRQSDVAFPIIFLLGVRGEVQPSRRLRMLALHIALHRPHTGIDAIGANARRLFAPIVSAFAAGGAVTA